MKLSTALLLTSLLLLVPTRSAWAHRMSDALLRLDWHEGVVKGRVDVGIRDLASQVDLDPNRDGRVTWGELRRAEPAVRDWLSTGLTLRQGEVPVAWNWGSLQVVDVGGEWHASMPLSATPASAGTPLTLRYDLLFTVDPGHRGLVRWQRGDQVATAVMSPTRQVWELPGQDTEPAGAGASFRQLVKDGMHHIWIGWDHLAFLLALLLPALRAVPADRGGWASLGAVAGEVARVVTAFTVAHSVTLALAAFHVVTLPSRWVETLIALSVAVAAWHNLRPIPGFGGARAAFGFGLIHGFGFAGVLQELDLSAGSLAHGLFAFNLGVELGQLVVVAVFLPVALLVAGTWFYRRFAVPACSLALLGLASYWAFERAFDWSLLQS